MIRRRFEVQRFFVRNSNFQGHVWLDNINKTLLDISTT